MNDLRPAQFDQFFEALYSYSPMNWQTELAAAACEGDWPNYICLPTGAGKTSTIDIAVFALAFQASLAPEERTAAMRTFLVVDRRTVVSEAFYRSRKLQSKLSSALESVDGGILKTVAKQLLSYTDGQAGCQPLAVFEMRGGIYRDRNWCSSLIQPMIVTSTVDQVGSRLLFRGYGVSNLTRPIQAAAVAHDSLIILDEAHISPAFSETLGYVKRYQQSPWCEQVIPRSLRIVEMTATPPSDSTAKKLEIKQSELDDPSTHIGRLVNTQKMTSLVVAEKVKGSKAPNQLATALVEQALRGIDLGNTSGDVDESQETAAGVYERKVVGIMCNMVATAKAVVETLQKNKAISSDRVHLVIGAMRPIDRRAQTDNLRRLIATGADRDAIKEPIFVVATQCIEVGADYDFDVLVTEAAPLDSLIQRFGRLNRAGRALPAVGCIVMRGDYVKTNKQLGDTDKAFKFVDPIYGNGTSYTWNWLDSVADEMQIDFGIASLARLTQGIDAELQEKVVSSKASAPVLLPAHVDMLCQTSQEPWPDPDVALWLHGPQRNDPEVQVCWRADLLPPAERSLEFEDAVRISLGELRNPHRHADLFHSISLCPPSSAECLSVPLRRVVSWLNSIAEQKQAEPDLTGDVPRIVDNVEAEAKRIPFPFRPVAWRGLDKSTVVQDVREIRPGDTLVFTPLVGGWTELGYLPAVNGWSCRDEQQNLLSSRLQSMEDSNATDVLCNADDFEKLATIDVGSQAFYQSRKRPILRLHPNLAFASECKSLFSEMRTQGEDYRVRKSELPKLLQALPEDLADDLANIESRRLGVEYYPNRIGISVTGPMEPRDADYALAEDDESDSYSQIIAGHPIELSAHLESVREETESVTKRLALDSFKETLCLAARAHDWGKADPRFQALLLGGDRYASIWEGRLFAKSAKMPSSLRERNAARQLASLPAGFRHEMLSLALAETHPAVLRNVEDCDLLLHLIASHHGHARPWAPVCIDDHPPKVSLEQIGIPELNVSKADRLAKTYHRVDSTVPSRFWRVTRKYGWWGASMLEAVLRISDHRVSRIESMKQADRSDKSVREPAGASS